MKIYVLYLRCVERRGVLAVDISYAHGSVRADDVAIILVAS
jgi:hypothetical protein